jgi:hypothetical protein
MFRISVREIANAGSSDIRCRSCTMPRDDDTPEERMSVIAEALADLIDRQDEGED